MIPRTQYARNGDVSIAYQVLGSGSLDLVVIPGWISHLEMDWMDPTVTSFLKRLASFSRLIRFDKRGTGLSDPIAGVPSLEERMEDVRTVMDAAGSRRAALLGYSEGGPMAVLFAATYPERTVALTLYGSFASGRDLGPAPARRMRDLVEHHWGEGGLLELFAPSIAHEEGKRAFMAAYERSAASPGMARGLLKALASTDVSDVLANVRVPTLVLHRRDDFIPIEGGRAIADKIPGARMVDLEGVDHLPALGDSQAITDEIEEFLTGARQMAEPERSLATVLFTDIVGSTERAGELGDARWRVLLERHNMIAMNEVERFGGVAVKSTGDGYLATFDGPARGVRCAWAMRDAMTDLGIDIRAGIHTGECERLGDDVAGLAVHIGARVASLAGPGEVLVSSTVKDLVAGSGIAFEDRGEHELKGVADRWRLHSASGLVAATP